MSAIYENETVAVGVLMMDADGYDSMAVFHGTIRRNESGYHLEMPGSELMEMRESWLAKLKPTVPELGEQFQGSTYSLIVGSLAGQA